MYVSCNINYKELLDIVGELNVLKYYFPNIVNLPTVISCPYREDRHPSFAIYISNKGFIKFLDYATNENGNIISLIANTFNISFNDAIFKIYNDLIGNNINNDITIDKKLNRDIVIKNEKTECKLQVKERQWQQYDIIYWSSYGCCSNKYIEGVKFLQSYGIKPISSFKLITTTDKVLLMNANKYAYVYYGYVNNSLHQKIYQPYATKFKWLSNGKNHYIDYLHSALKNKGDKLIITSSRKDVLCLMYQMNIPAICPSSETVNINEDVIKQLKERYKKIYVFFDNDFNKKINTGHIKSETLCKKYNLKLVEIPAEYKAKDPSDLYKKLNNKQKFKQIIKEILKW